MIIELYLIKVDLNEFHRLLGTVKVKLTVPIVTSTLAKLAKEYVKDFDKQTNQTEFKLIDYGKEFTSES